MRREGEITKERLPRPGRRLEIAQIALSVAVLALLSLLIGLVLSGFPRQKPDATSWVVGTIQDSTGRPVAGDVVIRRLDGRIAARQRTGAGGAYQVPLVPGIYRLDAFADGERLGSQLIRILPGIPTVLQHRLAGRAAPEASHQPGVTESAQLPPSVGKDFGAYLDRETPHDRVHRGRAYPPVPPPPSPAPTPPPTPAPPSLPSTPLPPTEPFSPPLPPPPAPTAPPPSPTAASEPAAPPAGSTPPVSGEPGTPSYLQNQPYTPVQVFYGTDRAPVGRPPRRLRHLAHYYGGKRGSLSYGWCWVTIPRGHQTGQVETPAALFEYDPAKHIVLRQIEPKSQDEFLAALRQRIEQSPGRQAFVFIHGYNVGFAEAARRTAQMYHDMKFPGAPIFYSWPSRDHLLSYWADEASVEWTVENLRQFLDLVARQSGAERIHLIAHSMGNRAMTQAVRELALAHGEDLPLFQEIVLAAPDIDLDVFTQLAQKIRSTARRVTVYASSKDRAIRVSHWFHGYPRAGESGPSVTKIDRLDGIDAVDASRLDTSFLGHAYYGSSILDDLSQVICLDKPAKERRRMTRCDGEGLWRLIKDSKAFQSVRCKCPAPVFGEDSYCPSALEPAPSSRVQGRPGG